MGRGVLYGIINRTIMVIGAYVIHVYAGRVLQPQLYGTFGVILSIMAILSIFLSNGVREAVSKNISTFPQYARRIYHAGIKVQLGLSVPMALAVFALSGRIASFLGDENLLIPLRICSAIILVHSLYFVHCGALNGLKRFLAENTVGSVYSAVRPVAVVFLIAAGWGVAGAMWGFLAASVTATLTGRILLGRTADDRDTALDNRKMFVPAISHIVIFGAVTVLLNVDLFFVKSLMPLAQDAGLYTAAAAFSKPAYWLAVSFGEVALPLVAASFAVRNIAQCRLYLSQVVRYITILFLPMIVIIAFSAEDLIVFFYAQSYAQAHLPLSILVFGIWLVGLASAMAYIMVAIGRERLMAIMALGTIALDIGLNTVLIPRLGLPGAALATSISAFGLLLAGGGYVGVKIGIDIRLSTIIRVTALSVILAWLTRLPLVADVPLIPRYILLYAAFGAALVATREMGPDDWAIAKRLLRPGRANRAEP